MSKTTLTDKQISEIADKFEAAACASPWSERGKAIADLPYYDGEAVAKEVALRGRRKAWQAFNCHPAVKEYALTFINSRGAGLPENVSLVTGLQNAAKSTRDQYGRARPAFVPEGGCPLKLHAVGGVRFAYSQESYADHSTTLVPILGEATDEQLAICRRNLSALVRRMDSHTGMAGSGCNYTASVVKVEAGYVAVIECRASISD
jgi:hypothetical protein